MRVCVACKHENPIEAEVCAQCGAQLRITATVMLGVVSEDDPITVSSWDQANVEVGSIAFLCAGNPQQLVVQVNEGVILGRGKFDDPLPSLDLTPFRAGLLGVSRQHAAIRPSGGGYSIMDMNSTNGTWVNATKLTPSNSVLLHNRDMIKLGDLTMFTLLPSSDKAIPE
jgi:hypothetical protein